MNVVRKKTTPRKYKTWQCGTCNKLLGLIYPDGVLTIKHKDLTMWVIGYVKTACRFCKTINTYRTDVKIEEIADENNLIGVN